MGIVDQWDDAQSFHHTALEAWVPTGSSGPYAHTAVAEVSETTYPATENIGYCPLSHHPVNEETDVRGGRQDNAVGFGVNTLIGILALHVALHRYVQDYMRMYVRC